MISNYAKIAYEKNLSKESSWIWSACIKSSKGDNEMACRKYDKIMSIILEMERQDLTGYGIMDDIGY